MASFQLVLMLPLWFLLAARGDAVGVTGSQEVRTLLSFREQNIASVFQLGALWFSWNETDETPCGWVGVRCTANHTVEEIDFSGWGLKLVSWDPLYELRDLSRLDLSSNILYQFLQGIGNLTGLTWLDLSRTNLYGNVPSSISACRNMRFLSLEQNSIVSIPSSLRDLVNLQYLTLAGNRLSGPFPKNELGELRSLVSLDLSRNFFEGSIPALPNLTNLFEFRLDDNFFTGFEEPWVVGSKGLQRLSVSNNSLQGTIPSSIGQFANLSELNMSSNNLQGKVPSGFSAQLSNGLGLDLSQNRLYGGLPMYMPEQNNRFGMSVVNLSHNLFTGNILVPPGSKLPRLFALDLSHNNLSGPIPSVFVNDRDLAIAYLWLQNNQLSGDVVDLLLGLSPLCELRLANNLFTGDLSRIANTRFASPQLLDLSNNDLQWTTSVAIPDPVQATLEVLTSGSFLQEFRAGGNNFSGTSLPTACFVVNPLFNYSFTVLDLSNSDLNGEILNAAFNPACLPALQLLNLSNNYATGPLPEGIIAEHGPQFVVDVSNNSLSGRLPSILPISNLYNPKYFTGNDGLCGDPLPPCPEALHQHGIGVPWWVLLVIIGGSVTVALGSCLAATWRWRAYQKQHQQDADLIRTLLERDSASLMPLRELKKATDNFADSAQIGEGGFGTVYTGKLSDGTVVAMKRSKREGSAIDKEQFLNEVRILSHVNHRHLVKLLGCCLENKVAVLVFEFISNGTLEEHLRGKIGANRLSWKQRLSIAIQTADALNYLHSAATFPIYHMDVKSANILLSKNLDAKVADFGISKLAPLHATHVSTMAVQGTIGYIDPEYYTSFKLTDKSDVYSFGVVLLELISAKRALDFLRSGEEPSLVNLGRPYIESGDLELFIDPVLSETFKDPTQLGKESMFNVGRLAMKCLEMQSRRRPSMNEVLKELQNCWEKLTGTCKNQVDSTYEDGENLQRDNVVLLRKSLSAKSYTSTIGNDGSGIQMSRLSSFQGLRSRSIV